MARAAHPKARYALVAGEIASAIGEGRYEVGDLLPSEAELCASYGISNHTVRHAMRVLREMKLVAPERGRGTRVVGTSSKARYVHALDSIPDIGELVRDTKIHVVRRRKILAADALVALPNGAWLLIEAVRYAEGQPMVWKHVYIDSRFPKAAKEVGGSSEPIYELIERLYGESLVRVRQEVGAVLIDKQAAEKLQVPAGTPGLAIARRYIGASGRVFEVTYSVYPADRFRYHSELRLEHADAAPGAIDNRRR